ncbi:MAG TPA: CdaR family protein [Bryobacteraceae bacterium]|nr:CdaR family protein [Bryobacteraceae bacterium]
MKRLFTENLGWKLLSLAIAVGLWLAVAREPEVATSLSVPVEFRNMRDDLDISGNLPDRVRLELRGPSGRLTRDNLSAVAAVLDLSDAQAGQRTYTIHARNLSLPSGVTFYRAVPSQITLHFDELTVRQEPVLPVFANQPAGYQIVSDQFSPTQVKIRGSEERVGSITQVKTDPIDLSGVVGEKIFHTHLNVGDPQVRLVEAPGDITVRVKLKKILNDGAP